MPDPAARSAKIAEPPPLSVAVQPPSPTAAAKPASDRKIGAAPPLPAPPPHAASAPPPTTPAPAQQVTVETETVPTVPALGVLNPVLPAHSLRGKRSQESVPRPPTSARGSQKRRSQRLAQGSRADFFAAKVADAVDEHESSSGDETFVYAASTDPLRRATGGGRRRASDASGHLGGTLRPAPSAGSETEYPFDSEFVDSDSASPLRAGRPLVVPRTEARSDDELPWAPANKLGISANANHSVGSVHLVASQNSLGPPRFPGRPLLAHARRTSRTRTEASPQREGGDSLRAKHSYLQRWRAPVATTGAFDEPQRSRNIVAPSAATAHNPSADDEDERASLLRGRPSLYNYHSSLSAGNRRWGPADRATDYEPHAGSNAGPNEPNFESSNRGKYGASSTPTRIVAGVVMMLILIMSTLLVGGLVLAAGQPLRGFDLVSLSDVLVSDRELVFSLVTRARNPGLFGRSLSEGELDVFATTLYASDAGESWGAMDAAKRTVWLGNLSRLESPLVFDGAFSGQTQWRTASAKLVSPLGNKTEQWAEISAHEFELTIKGVLTYTVLGSEHRESVSQACHVRAPDFVDTPSEL